MKVKELYEFLKESLEKEDLTLDSEVIVVGEYNYGESLGRPYATTMSHIDEETVVSENEKVLAFSIGAYLYEHEDTGYSNMWVDSDTLQELREADVVEG